LKIEMFTMHENDNGTIDNIHNLTETELAIRKVDMVDIAFDPIPKRDYQAELDPTLFSSEKTRSVSALVTLLLWDTFGIHGHIAVPLRLVLLIFGANSSGNCFRR
jgi:hypothetical protein